MTLRLLDTPEMPARRNLALTAALLAGGGEVLRLQRFPRCAIVGAHQELAREVDLGWCARTGVEVARRMTGGGAIVMEPGILGWELVLHQRRFPDGLGAAAALLCQGAADGLSRLGIAARFRPRNDIVVGTRKLGGTGGYFDGERLLFQGTVLVAPDLAFMAAALRLPAEKLSAAGGFADRLTALQALGCTAPPGPALAEGLAAALGTVLQPDRPTAAELALAARLHDAEIGTDAFVHGADLAGSAPPDAVADLAEPGAAVRVALRLRQGGSIAAARISGDMFVTPPGAVHALEAALRDVALDRAEAAATAFLAAARVALLAATSCCWPARGAAARGRHEAPADRAGEHRPPQRRGTRRAVLPRRRRRGDGSRGGRGLHRHRRAPAPARRRRGVGREARLAAQRAGLHPRRPRRRRAALGLSGQSRPFRHDGGRPDPRMRRADGRCGDDGTGDGGRHARADLLMITVRGWRFPSGLLYDVPNHCWYRMETEGVRMGMTEVATALAGEILAYTPKRAGLPVEAGRSCAVIESGKWVGPVRAAFAGTVLAVNGAMMARPSLANAEPYGAGWVSLLRPDDAAALAGLVSGNALEAAYAAWMDSEEFPERQE